MACVIGCTFIMSAHILMLAIAGLTLLQLAGRCLNDTKKATLLLANLFLFFLCKLLAELSGFLIELSVHRL